MSAEKYDLLFNDISFLFFRLSGKKKPKTLVLGFNIRAWQFPTFAWQTATLSSALSGFTSEFGMGSGGSRSLWSPSKLVCWWLNQLWATGLGFSACGLLYPLLLFWKSVTQLSCCVVFCVSWFVFCYWRLSWHLACLCKLDNTANWLGVIWSSLTGN